MRAESQARTGIRAFLRLDSDVEPQESRIHLSVRDAACSRLVLRFSPLLSRQKEREANGYKNAYQNGYENSGRFHVIFPANSLYPHPFGCPVAVPPLYFSQVCYYP